MLLLDQSAKNMDTLAFVAVTSSFCAGKIATLKCNFFELLNMFYFVSSLVVL